MTTQSHLYKQDDDLNLPTCCEYHRADQMPGGSCREGRQCPERTRRLQEAEARWPRDIAMGDESGRPDLVQPPREAMPVQFAGKEPTDWSAVTRWGAAVVLCVVWALIVIYRK